MSQTKNRPGILIILDGFGINPDKRFNAVAQAKTPTLDRLLEKYPHTQLDASESNVGLPNGFMGNSEVGHLNIGAGRIVYQDFSLISHAIEEGTFFANPVFLDLFEQIKKASPKSTLHLMGLLSDGGVHSHISHLFALLRLAKSQEIPRVAIHAFMDGRDTSPTSGVGYLRQLQSFCSDAGVGRVATVMGRFYAMDRDKRWERVEKAYQAVVAAQAAETFSDPVAYLQESYNKNQTDEFVIPAVARHYEGMNDGDGVIFYNFRADRARELTRAITQKDFGFFQRQHFPTLSGFVGMTNYDPTLGIPSAYEKVKVPQTLGDVVSEKGWKQLRIAETEKYAHVTYFFNGGEEKELPGEKRILVPSPRDVKTYDLKPQMSAAQVTEKLLAELRTDDYQFAVVNFANPDMVGHTGNLRAAISAVETVDECLGKIFEWVEKKNALAILTADHGNCEMMQDAAGNPLTSHTLLPVPFMLVDPLHPGLKLTGPGRLCDIAPTLLELWGIKKPVEMTGRSLISHT